MNNDGNDFEKLRDAMNARQASIANERTRTEQRTLDLQKAGHDKLQNIVIPFVENRMPAASRAGFSLEYDIQTVPGHPELTTSIKIKLSPAGQPSIIATLSIHQEGNIFVVQGGPSSKTPWHTKLPVESIVDNSVVGALFSRFMQSVTPN